MLLESADSSGKQRSRRGVALIVGVHEVEEAGEEDEDVDDAWRRSRPAPPSESVRDGDEVQEDMSKKSLRPSGRENVDGRRWFISLLSVLWFVEEA